MEQVKMKNRFYRLACIWLILVVSFSLCGCVAEKTVKYAVPDDKPLFDSEVVTENNTLQLLWNTEYQFGYAKNKQTGDIISPVPFDYLKTGEFNGNIFSPLLIEYYNISDTFIQNDVGYFCVEDANFSSEKTEYGVKATYYFTEPEITVSLNYKLKDDCLYLYVDSSDIFETGKTKIISISLAPYFSSVKNTDSKQSYLFVPSGSGSLMYTSDDVKGTAREFTADVYGTNLARTKLDNIANGEQVLMPVYGAKNNDNISVGIISSSDNNSVINALSGDINNGYSCVYPSFTVRDFKNIEWDTGKETNGKEMYLDTVLINEKIPGDRIFGINLYSMHKKDADYLDMADIYKNYLTENNLLKKNGKINADYSLELLGGVSLKEYTLGFPHQDLKVLTDFEDAENILTELLKTGQTPYLILSGFGKDGLSDGAVGDSFKISSKFGKIKKLTDYALKNSIDVGYNLNLLTYSKSGKGFSFTFDSAKTANGESIYIYPQKVNVRIDNEKEKFSHVLGTQYIENASKKALKFLNKKRLGFYSNNFGSVNYSDCTDTSGMLGGSIFKIKSGIDSFNKECKSVAFAKANAYCAGIIDAVTETPVSNGDYQCMDEYIPFYEYVFGEYTRLYGPSVNICNDKTGVMLKCIESGVYPSFTVAKNVDISLVDSVENYLFACNFDGNKEYIEKLLTENKDYYENIRNAHIVDHKIVQKGITKTLFSNNVEVTVNHTDKNYVADGQIVKAYSYTFNLKGDNR